MIYSEVHFAKVCCQVLWFYSAAMANITNKSNIGNRKFWLTCNGLPLSEIRTGTQAGTEKHKPCRCCLIAAQRLILSFLLSLWPPRNSAPHSGLGISMSFKNQDNTHPSKIPQDNLIQVVLQLRLHPEMILDCVKLTTETNNNASIL